MAFSVGFLRITGLFLYRKKAQKTRVLLVLEQKCHVKTGTRGKGREKEFVWKRVV
jgi:hypothetical protein